MHLYVGWDWGGERHDIALLDEAGSVVRTLTVAHDEAGIARAIEEISSGGEVVGVAIESSRGLVVDRLAEAGLPVVPVHPNAFFAARPRWGASRAKCDSADAVMLADFLRTDGHRFRGLAVGEEAARDLQELSRLRNGLLSQRLACANRLRALLERHWPGAAVVFQRIDSPIATAFLKRHPTPGSSARLGETRMAAFLKRSGYSGHRSAAELLSRLRSAPRAAGLLSETTLTALVLTEVGALEALMGATSDAERAMLAALDAHPKAGLLAGLPRVGRVNLAQLIAEVGPILEHCETVERACAQVGASPVTRESGKSRSVSFRWAAPTEARRALAIFADNSRHADEQAAMLYRQARARGKRHPHAVRIVARSWMRVIWACWHSDTAYDPLLRRSRRGPVSA